MDYTKELTIFRGQKTWLPPQKAGNYKVRVIAKPQPVTLTHFDETSDSAVIKIISRESEETRPIFDIKNDVVVDDLPAQHCEPSDFLIVKPLQHHNVIIDLQWGQNKLPIMLPKEFFTFNEPINILTSNWKLPDTPTAPVIDAEPAFEGSPEDLANCMAITEVPTAVIEKAGLKEGWYLFEGEYGTDDFIKSLSTNLLGGGIGAVVNNFELLKNFFPGGKFYLKQYNGKYFVIFKGIAGTRATIKGTRYALKNPKVMALSVTKGPTAGVDTAIDGLKPTLKGNILTVVIIGVVDVIAWQQGMLSDDGKFVSDLLVEFGMDLGKAVVSTIVSGFLVGLGCIIMFGLGFSTLPVFVVVISGIALAVMIGMGLDYIDERSEFTARLRNKGNVVEKTLIKAFNENIVEPLSQSIYRLERHIEWLYLRNIPFAR
jgi:hypothetical protein